MHAPGMVFENHTAGERAEGDEVREHIAAIFANWPDLTFATRRLYARDGLVVCEWTATATRKETGEQSRVGRRRRLPVRGRQDRAEGVYSASHRARVTSG